MLTDAELSHIAKLARITVDDERREKFKKDLSSILSYVDMLNSVDTESVSPLYQTTGQVNALRPDAPNNSFPMDAELLERLVGQAPDHEGRFVKVKAVLNR